MTSQADWVPDGVDQETPSAARIYDYVLGGTHNFPVDRLFAEKALQIHPDGRRVAIMNRAFLRRAVLFMIDAGIRQFLDLGSGIPTLGSSHEVAEEAAPGSKVVYVDLEPVAVAHSRLILAGNENAAVLHADITDVEKVLNAPETRLLDFSKPIGLLAITIGHYISRERGADKVFAAYRDALAPGSFLALTHITDDFAVIKGDEVVALMKKTQNNVFPRTRAEVLALFEGFELVEAGLVTTSQWRADTIADVVDPELDGLYAGVGRKP